MEIGTKIKTAIYGANILARPIGKTIASSSNLGNFANPIAGIGYGILDVVGALSDKARSSKFMRLTKVIGATGFGISSFLNLYSFINGHFQNIDNFLLNGSMAYQLGRDTFENY